MLSPLRSRPSRPGFSLVELAVTLTVIAGLSALLVFWFSSTRSPQLDAAAKTSLISFSRIQEDAFRRDGAPASAAEILAGSFDRGDVTFTADPSDGASVVSVVVADSVVVGAARSGDDCWGLRLDTRPSASSPRSWWFVAVSAPTCTGALFESVTFPGDGTGASPDAPTIL